MTLLASQSKDVRTFLFIPSKTSETKAGGRSLLLTGPRLDRA
jgi:hypothetical protein